MRERIRVKAFWHSIRTIGTLIEKVREARKERMMAQPAGAFLKGGFGCWQLLSRSVYFS
jgi:hypothetical protein